MPWEMHDPQATIFRELSDPRMDQRNVAMTYGFIIRQELNTAGHASIRQYVIDGKARLR